MKKIMIAVLAAPLWGVAGVTAIDSPITLDGKFDEAVWAKAEWIDDFLVPSGRPSVKATGSRKPIEGTSFAMLADDRNIYIGIKAEHHALEEMKNLPVDGQWATEACEVFLAPSGDAFEFYHFLICYPGFQWAMFYSENGGIKPDPFGPVWERAIADVPNGWTAEIRIPLSALYMSRNSNWSKNWRVNVSRTCRKKGNGLGENSCWSDVVHNYGESKTFRTYGPFPQRAIEDDVFIRSATADIRGREGGKSVGTLKVSAYVAKGGEFVFTSSYSKPLKLTLQDGDNEIDVSAIFPENGRHMTHLALTRESDGHVCERKFPLRVDYQAIRVKLTTPQYRDNFYPGQNAEKVRGTVRTVASDPVTLTLEGPGFKKQTIVLSQAGEFSFDTRGFAYGDATLTATCGSDVFTKKIRRLPPLPEGQHAAWVENGNFVIDGRPTVMRNIYAEGFAGGKVFDKKYNEDKYSGRLHITTNIVECRNIDPNWVAKELKYVECLKDMPISQKMRDALDKAMDKGRRYGCYYYGVDEPECHGISAVYLEHLHNYVAEKDPYRPIVCCCRSGETYGNTADVFAPHPYLNPYNRPDGTRTYSRDPNVLGSYVDAYHPELHPDKCIGGAPTCFCGNNDYPTFEEYVLNYWAEFVRGAKVMLPYAYHDLGDRPQMYEGTRYMFESIEALEDVILYGTRKTLLKTKTAECVVWTLPAGDRVFALLNFTQKPQTVTVPGLYGAYREFRGTRTFSSSLQSPTFELKPHETFIASEKAYDTGLKTFAAVKAEIDALEYERTHRDNQLFGRTDDMIVTASSKRRGPFWDTPVEVFDGTRDVLGWYHHWATNKFYQLEFKANLTPSFDRVCVFGTGHAGYTVSVPDEKGGWEKLTPRETQTEGLGITLVFDRVRTPRGLRFEFPGDFLEVYEIELPKVK